MSQNFKNLGPDAYRDNEENVVNFADHIREKSQQEKISITDTAQREVERFRDVVFGVNTQFNGTQLRLRDDEGKVISKIKKGAKIKIMGDMAQNTDDDRTHGVQEDHIWVKVEVDADETEAGGTGKVQGWVSTEYIRSLSEPVEPIVIDPVLDDPDSWGDRIPEPQKPGIDIKPEGGSVVPDAPTKPVESGGGVVPDAPTKPVESGGGVVPDAPTKPVESGGGVVPDAPTKPVESGGGVVPDAPTKPVESDKDKKIPVTTTVEKPTSTEGNSPNSQAENSAPITTASETPTERVRHHIIEEGDTINKIANKYGVSLSALLKANDLDKWWKSPIHIGDDLKIPLPEVEDTTSDEVSTVTTEEKKTYEENKTSNKTEEDEKETVTSHDNLGNISHWEKVKNWFSSFFTKNTETTQETIDTESSKTDTSKDKPPVKIVTDPTK